MTAENSIRTKEINVEKAVGWLRRRGYLGFIRGSECAKLSSTVSEERKSRVCGQQVKLKSVDHHSIQSAHIFTVSSKVRETTD